MADGDGTGTAQVPELTQAHVARILTKPLEAQSVFLAAGPTIFDTDGSPVRIPAAPSFVKALEWIGENEQIPGRDFDTNEVTLLPSTMKSVKTITRYSNELARQAVVNLDAAIQGRMVADVANKIDTQLMSATGDGVTTPRGLFAYAGIQKITGVGALTLDALLTAWGMALAANVNMGRLRWMLTPGDFVALRKIKDTTGNYILNADPSADAVFRLFGAPVSVSARIPNTTGATPTGRAALVDMSQIAVARDLAPSVKILTERYADYDQQAVRVVARYDAAPINPEAIVVLEGITRA